MSYLSVFIELSGAENGQSSGRIRPKADIPPVHMTPRLAITLVSGAIALLLVASLLLFNTDVSHRIVGALYLACGAAMAGGARWLPQQALSAGLLLFLQPLLDLRPVTFMLFGSGVAVCGALLVSGLG